MNYENLFNQGLQAVKDSPIRVIQRQNIPFEINNENFNNIVESIPILINRVEKSLNVVILGEVKAGKSTFVNALVGGELSPVDISEATAAIIEFYYAKKERGTIHKYSKTSIEDTPKKIFQILSDNIKNKKYYQDVEFVEISSQLLGLKKMHIVDTPGLATTNEQNENKTIDFIQKADVVLWILNANYLGQLDVQQKLIEIAKLGKPIIAIINKIDQVGSNPDRLVQFASKKLGIYLDRIFTLSAQNAYNAVMKSDLELLTKSGFVDIKNHLLELDADARKVHLNSLISSFNALLTMDVTYHKSIEESISLLQKTNRDFINKIEYHKETILDTIYRDLEHWIEHEILKSEENNIITEIKKMGLINSSKLEKKIKSDMESIFSTENLKKEIHKKNIFIKSEFEKNWRTVTSAIEAEIKINVSKFKDKEYSNYNNVLASTFESGSELLKKGASRGAILGGSIFVLNAIIAAASFPVIIVGLPIAILSGIIPGMTFKSLDFKKQKNNLLNEIRSTFKDYRNNKLPDSVLPKLKEDYTSANKNVCEDLINSFTAKACSSWTLEDFESLQKNISKHVTRIESNKLEII